MIAIKEKIIDSYDITRYSNLLFMDIPWLQRPQTLYFGIFILLSIPLPFIEFKINLYYLIIWGILFITGLFAMMNPLFKRISEKTLNIKANKNIISHWLSPEFKEKQLEKFYDKLEQKKVLTKKKNDIYLLEDYVVLFENESIRLKVKDKFIYGSGAILLFILPIWNTTTSILLNKSENIIDTLPLIFKLLFIIYSFIYFLNLLKYWLEDFFNRNSMKYLNISRSLNELKLNLKLKYTS